jgi:hypothetical protein
VKLDPNSVLALHPHRTPFSNIDVPTHWTRIPSLGLDVSAPLGDVAPPHESIRYARIPYRDALRYCATEGYQLLTADVLGAMRDVLPTIAPVTLPATARMSSVEWSRVHDATVAERLGGAVVAVNIGKHWVQGAPGGRSWLMGWWVPDLAPWTYDEKTGRPTRRGPGWVQPRPAAGSRGVHDDRHLDYSMTTLVMRPSLRLEPLDVPMLTEAAALVRRLFLGGHSESAGDAIVRVARGYVGTTEATGRNDGEQIKAFFAGCTRRISGVERPTGWASGWDWCAAFASWCVHVALSLPVGSIVPVGRRIAVRELVEDARACGRLETSRLYRPKPGDLYIGARGGGDPLLGGTGHVRVFASDRGEGRYVGIGGNEDNGVRESVHRYDDATWRAWVRVT